MDDFRRRFLKLGSSLGLLSVASARAQPASAQDGMNIRDFAPGSGQLERAIVEAQQHGQPIRLRAGEVVSLDRTVRCGGSPVTLVGEVDSALRQGSSQAACTIRWEGGESPIFQGDLNQWGFVGLDIENVGTATDFIDLVDGQRLLFSRLSFVAGNKSRRFSRAIIRSVRNNLGYSVFDTITFLGAAPAFVDIDGGTTREGVTPIHFVGNSLFESNALGDVTVLRVRRMSMELVLIERATFNQQMNGLCIVDTSDHPAEIAIGTLIFRANEIDIANPKGDIDQTRRAMRLTNVGRAIISENELQGGGQMTALFTLTNSTVVHGNNKLMRLNGPMLELDKVSRQYQSAVNQLQVQSTKGVANDAPGSGIVQLRYQPIVALMGHLAEAHGTVFRVDVTDSKPWTLSFYHPVIGSFGGYFFRGQTFKLMIRNLSGGAMGEVTLVGGRFRVAGGALPAPAPGFSRTVELVFDGENFVEIGRTPLDVPN